MISKKTKPEKTAAEMWRGVERQFRFMAYAAWGFGVVYAAALVWLVVTLWPL